MNINQIRICRGFMMNFNDIFIDCTKHAIKLKTTEYQPLGKNIIIDQSQNEIAGYTDLEEGIYNDIPALIFGDHTRCIKYVDKPFFIGADGVKVLKIKTQNSNYKYWYYALKSIKIPNTGYNRHFKWLKEAKFIENDYSEQLKIVKCLDSLVNIINAKQRQLLLLDDLIKSRFVELFGDPITNSKKLPQERMEQRFNLKAGITTTANDIHEFEANKYEVPCYGGNGIRGYVKDKSYSGSYPIIGRQGALCGNVQYATGEFHATEHAVLVSTLKDDNTVWVYHLLKLMDLYRYHTGAAQPGLAVKTLNTVDVIVADKAAQNEFATFVEQTDKSKFAIQQSIDELQTLYDSLMQEYFG